jgi:hypothetical protein
MPDLFAAATITGPFGPHYINRRTPCSMAYNATGDATITVMLPDSTIITISAPATSYSTRTFPGILSLSVTGGPVTIEIYTPDMVVDPKYLASTTATVTGTVKTDIGQGTAPVSQVVLTEPLGTSYDARGRTWTLGSGDTPNRSWTLGSGDVPSRGWTLGSGDTPGRSWTLGSGDTPGRSWALGSGDTPGRSWTLGSGDVPSRGWTLGSGDTPGRSWALGSGDTPSRSWTLSSGDTPSRSWTLGSGDTPSRSWTLGSTDTPNRSWALVSTDNPDVSQNQRDSYATVPYLVSGYAQASFGGSWALSGNYVQVTITITPGSFLILDEMDINTGNAAYLWNAEFNLNSDLRSPESSWGAFMGSAVGLLNQTSIPYRAFGYECTILNDSGSNQTGTLGGNSKLTITSFSYSPHRYIYNGGSSNISIYYQWEGTSSNNTAATVYLGIYYRYAGTITFAYSTNPSSSPSTGGSGGGGYPCWSADTLIDTPQGPVPHHQLKVGDTVYGLGGVPETISELITNDHTETVYEVEPGVWVTGDQVIRSPDGSTITPLQIERGGTELSHRTVSQTFDLKVPSGWVRIPSGRYLSDKTAPGP